MVTVKASTGWKALSFIWFLFTHAAIPILVNFAGTVMPLYEPQKGWSAHNFSFSLWLGLILLMNSTLYFVVWTDYFCNESGLIPWTVTFPIFFSIHAGIVFLVELGTCFGCLTHFMLTVSSQCSGDVGQCISGSFAISSSCFLHVACLVYTYILLVQVQTKEARRKTSGAILGA